MEIKSELKYTKDHEWVRIENNIATVGITDYAQSELGDIVYVEIETLDESLKKEEVFGSVEAVKTVSDLFLPISGKIIEINQSIEDNPEVINEDPYERGWIVKIQVDNPNEMNELLDSESYKELIGL
ncbi:MAG: glycine cleavage system protein GcvH [Flavobacteriaceae bacterium]|tara:strand:- start:184 stop:564 length:381 start_codon:yes stop_codon:yes gene_type:complete